MGASPSSVPYSCISTHARAVGDDPLIGRGHFRYLRAQLRKLGVLVPAVAAWYDVDRVQSRFSKRTLLKARTTQGVILIERCERNYTTINRHADYRPRHQIRTPEDI